MPYYITSNPFIANAYAVVTIRYIQDCVNQGEYDPEQPFYILEIGTGAGKFSFYTMRRIFELQKKLNLDRVKIVYIMSDFAESNLQYWREHPALQPFVQRQQLVFGLFNIEKTEGIFLSDQNKTLTEGSIKNPLTVFTNYLFDSVSHDAFHVENGVLSEALININTLSSNFNKQTKVPIDLQKIRVFF